MELFTNTANTYKTRENAVKKLENVLGKETMNEVRWIIGVNPEGRFFPIILPWDQQQSHLITAIHHGLCVVA